MQICRHTFEGISVTVCLVHALLIASVPDDKPDVHGSTCFNHMLSKWPEVQSADLTSVLQCSP